MDFSFTEEQELLRRTVQEFARRELAPIAQRIDEAEVFPWESIPKLASLGLFGVGIDPEFGGSGGGYIETAIVSEELAHACASTCVIWGVNTSLAAQAILRFGNQEQKHRLLIPLAKGQKLGAFALTEPGSGSDAASLQTSARRDKNGYILNGSKVFISNGDVANTIVLFATLDRKLRDKGITAFVVEKGTPGLTTQKQKGKLGIRGSSTAELFLEECRVQTEDRLGEDGEGFKVALGIIDSSRIMIAAQAVGIAQAALDASIKYVGERRQFGKPIGEFQGIQWMLSDMATSIDAARLLTFRAAYLKDKGLPFIKESSMAKLYAAEVAMNVTTKAIQLHGGYGYFKDSPVERYFRDAKVTEIYEGTSEIQRLVIARHLLSQNL